ncbi:MAG TPA: flagellar hook-associated protein FlgL [Acidobacteriaceae bacterium]|nr:flagellar hook-associated protein FlgL [Acidobacteriaceae bacterium]
MRVNPDYVSDLVSSLNQVTANEQTITEEISTGVTVNSLSDNPAAAGQNVLLSAQLNAVDTFSQTASSVESMLQVGDSALGNVITQLTSAISLATEANNGTLSASNEQSIAIQLTGVRDEVLSLANSSYMGQYVFAGSQGGTIPFTIDTTTSPATVTYSGDTDVSYVGTPTGQQIQTNIPGSQIFTAAGANNVLGALNDLIADYSSGSPSATSASDLENLNTALNYVSQQRVILDDSITRLTAAGNYSSSEATQLASAQDSLIQTNMAQAASQLSSAETQQASLTQVIAAIDNQGNLFNYLQ